MLSHLVFSGFDSQKEFSETLSAFSFLMKYLIFPLKTDTQSLGHEMATPKSHFGQLNSILY